MSYDITLVRRRPGQTWDEALTAREEAVVAGAQGDVPPETRAEWHRIADELQRKYPRLERFDGDDATELTDPETGLQVQLFVEEAAVAVPYWHSDEAAAEIIGQMRAITLFLEERTGLEAYDPQLEQGVRESTVDAAAAALSDVTARLPGLVHAQGSVPKGRGTWWQFWKR
jgi:hypothetical protein